MHTSIFNSISGLFAPAGDGTGGGGGDIIDPSSRVGTIELTTQAPQMNAPAPVVVTEPAAVVTEPAAVATTPLAAPQWTAESFLDSIGMKDLKPDDKRLGDFKALKGIIGKAMEANQTQAVKITNYDTERVALSKELAEAKKAIGTGTGTSADVVKVQAELKAMQDKHTAELAEWNEEKAKKALTNNEAFKVEFEGKKAHLFNAAKEAATEAGLDADKLDVIFEMKSELQIRKAIDALELDDTTTETMLRDKALAHLDLEKQKEAILTGKSGKKASESAAEWLAYEANLSGAFTRQFTEGMRGELIQAVDVVGVELAKESGVFATPHGATVLEEIRGRFNQGFDLTHNEMIKSMALARVAPIYEKLAVESTEKLRAAEEQIAVLTRQGPGSVARTPSGVGGGGNSNRPTGEDPFGNRVASIELPVR